MSSPTTHRNTDAADRVTNEQARAVRQYFRLLHALPDPPTTFTRQDIEDDPDIELTHEAWMHLLDRNCLERVALDKSGAGTYRIPDPVADYTAEVWESRDRDGCPVCGAPGFETIVAGELLRCKSCNERWSPDEWRGDS